MKHGLRYVAALGILISVAMIPVRYWMSLAYPTYFAALLALALVPFIGEVNMGARRWIEFGGLQFQPSEAMKIGLVLGLARYYHGLRAEQVSHILYLIPPALMVGAPVGLIFIQPDLGTALHAGGDRGDHDFRCRIVLADRFCWRAGRRRGCLWLIPE